MPCRRFEQVQKVCSTLVPLEFYPFTETTQKCLFLNGTPYSRLSRFSVQPAFSALFVLIYNTINRGICFKKYNEYGSWLDIAINCSGYAKKHQLLYLPTPAHSSHTPKSECGTSAELVKKAKLRLASFRDLLRTYSFRKIACTLELPANIWQQIC